jgi:NAD(P)-dependent dehydrogenase (short-subunit alcohol dehydrogenase family)
VSARPKVLLLTGASRGIGHATVKRFSDAGWRIITCSREAVPEECKRDPNWTHHITADLGDPADLDHLVAEAGGLLDGGLHALVNNAGVSPKSPTKERLGCLNSDLAAWHSVFQLNFFVPLMLARAFADALAQGKGAIVNVTSIAGHIVHPFAGSAYSTSKAALSALTREMAVEFARLGVRVNAVAPGEIKTAMLSPKQRCCCRAFHCIGSATPKMSPARFSFCAATTAAYVTGTEIFVNGGQHVF